MNELMKKYNYRIKKKKIEQNTEKNRNTKLSNEKKKPTG